MTSQFFVKFDYQGKIKKLVVSDGQFTWVNMCKKLSETFSIPEDNIKLSYKDPDDDLITACCDEDLNEAYKLAPSKHALKFFVSKDNRKKNKREDASKSGNLSRANSLKMEKDSFIDALAMKNDSKIHSDGQAFFKGIGDSQEEKVGLVKEEVKEVKTEIQKIGVCHEEVEQLLSKLFQTSEAKREINELKTRLGLIKPLEDKDVENVHFDIEQQRLSDYIVATFKKAFLEPMDNKNKDQIDLKEEEKEVSNQKENNSDSSKKDLLNVSLKETIYEKSYFSLPREAKNEDFKMMSLNETSMNVCKDLSSTHGVKLALKFENGKMKLMSIPIHEYSIIESVEDSENSRADDKLKLQQKSNK